MKKNQIEGHTWSYQTLEEMLAHFPYWTEKTLRRIIKSLVDKKIIMKEHFDKNPFNRINYYAFIDEDSFILNNVYESPNGQMQMPKRANEICPNGQMYNKDHISYTHKETLTPPTPSSFATAHSSGDSPKGETRTEPPKQEKKTDQRKERAKDVNTSDSEHQKLVDEFGQEKTKTFYITLSEWKNITPKSKWKKGDYLSIRLWVIQAVKEIEMKMAKTDKNVDFTEEDF